jgi:hypothetical protein
LAVEKFDEAMKDLAMEELDLQAVEDLALGSSTSRPRAVRRRQRPAGDGRGSPAGGQVTQLS